VALSRSLRKEVPVIDLAIYPKTLDLKSGKSLTIRPMNASDEAGLLKFLKGIPLIDRTALRDDVTDEKTVHEWIRDLNYSQVIPLLGIVDGEIVANGTLHFSFLRWTRHLGEIRILVNPALKGHGIGQAIIHELLSLGVSAGLERLTAMRMDVEDLLIRVFRSLGFREIARIPRQVEDIHGKRHDLVVLAVEVADIWEQQERLSGTDRYNTMSGEY
jgi:L-amino acid N-acyltransferase YncA